MKSAKSRLQASPSPGKTGRKLSENLPERARKPSQSCNTSFKEAPVLRAIHNVADKSISPLPCSAVDLEWAGKVREMEGKARDAQEVLERQALLIMRVPEGLLQKVQLQGNQLLSLTHKLTKAKQLITSQSTSAQTALHRSHQDLQRLSTLHQAATAEVHRLTELLKEDRPSCSEVGQLRLKIQQIGYQKSMQEAEIARLTYDNEQLRSQTVRAHTVEVAYYKLQQDYLALEHAHFLANSKLKGSSTAIKTIDRLKQQLESAHTELAQTRKTEKSKDLELQNSVASIKALRAQLFSSSQQLERTRTTRYLKQEEDSELRKHLEESMHREATLRADLRQIPSKYKESELDLQTCEVQLRSTEWRLASMQARYKCLEQVCQATQQACDRLETLSLKAGLVGEVHSEMKAELQGIRRLCESCEQLTSPRRSKSSGELVVIK